MQCASYHDSPLGKMLLTADEGGLAGLCFVGAKYCASLLPKGHVERENRAIREAKAWLELYFSGAKPDFRPGLKPRGTPFQLLIWDLLLQIPYGKTASYGELAKIAAQQRGLKSMSAQAVGGAVGRNPVAIIIPCHRVIGARGALTGYAAGLPRKAALLALERGKPMNEACPGRGQMCDPFNSLWAGL